MEVAIYALGIIAGILLTSAFFFLGVDRWYNARLGLLLLFFGIALTGGTICLKWFQEVLKDEVAAKATHAPAQTPEPPPNIGNTGQSPINKGYLSIIDIQPRPVRLTAGEKAFEVITWGNEGDAAIEITGGYIQNFVSLNRPSEVVIYCKRPER